MDLGSVGPGYRLSPGAPVNNCRWASTPTGPKGESYENFKK